MRRLAGHIVPLAAVAVLSGCAFLQSGGASARPGSVAAQARVHGGTAGQRTLLGSILRRTVAGPIPDVTIASSPGALTFRARSRVGLWESWLVTGAFSALSARRGLPAVRIDHATFGSDRADARCGGTVPLGAPRRAALRASISRDLRRAGLAPVSISFVEPLGIAPLVIAQTRDAGARLGAWQPRVSLRVDERTLDGIYLEVRSPTGRVVFFAGRSTRCRIGLSSVGHGVQLGGS